MRIARFFPNGRFPAPGGQENGSIWRYRTETVCIHEALSYQPLQNVGVLRDPLLIVSDGHIALDRLTFGKEAETNGK